MAFSKLFSLDKVDSSEMHFKKIFNTQNANTQISMIYGVIYWVLCFKVQIKHLQKFKMQSGTDNSSGSH